MNAYMPIFVENMTLIVLAAIWLIFLWQFYLNLRQAKLMRRFEHVPGVVSKFMTQEVYSKARSYGLDNNKFGNIKDWFSTIITTLTIVFFGYYHCWRLSEIVADACGLDKKNEITISSFCLFFMSLIMTIIGLPFSIYKEFVLEQKHGFNKQTPAFFAKDQVKKFAVTQVLLIPIMCASIWIIKNCGDYFFVILWVFQVVMTVFMMIIYPEFIAPLFDKYSPLPDGNLRSRIEELAASVGFPLYKLFIVEGSKRSSHSNAYMYGFFNSKRIVLYDTLVKEYYKPTEGDDRKDVGCDTEEVVAILAHELGHWKYNHVMKRFVLAQVSFMLNILPFAKLMTFKPMYAAFGFTHVQPVFIGLIIVTSYFLIPLNTVMSYLVTVLSRKFEFEADTFGAQMGYSEPLKQGLIKLYKDNLGYPIYDKLYSAWYHDHPPLLERLENLEKDD